MRSSWVRQLKTLQMELDGEGTANFEQLQDLIRKECDKRDRTYAWLEDKCNKLEQQVTQKNPKKHATEGPISKPQRTRRLEEKQIKPKERSEPTKDSPKKRLGGLCVCVCVCLVCVCA